MLIYYIDIDEMNNVFLFAGVMFSLLAVKISMFSFTVKICMSS